MISATGGVFIRVVWPNEGPSAHFLLAEIFTARIQNLFEVYARLYGEPRICPPEFRTRFDEARMKKAA
jgi:hypothetical protein